MKIFKSVEQFIKSKIEIKSFVPTMGNLHKGHLSLIDKAKKISGPICVTIYVNEAQFTEKNDFEEYPISLESDIDNLRSKEVDYLLIPKKIDIEKFSKAFNKEDEPRNLTTDLCGKYRPGHFFAVIDIIYRFLQIINPKNIILGEKDFQQLLCVQELIRITNNKVNIISSPTIRTDEGLALSSRNQRLSDDEKLLANNIYQTLIAAKNLFNKGYSIDAITKEIYEIYNTSPIKLEYFSIRDLKTLQHTYDDDLIALIAVYIGKIRLIDNIIIRSHP